MKEKEDRVVNTEKMNSVVRSLDFSHLFEFVCLGVTDELCDGHKVVAVVLDFV